MDFFFVEYRDPIFGLIVLFATILLVALLSFFWGMHAKKREGKTIEKFVRKFEGKGALDPEHTEFLANSKLGAETLCALASVFSKSGDFDKAVSVYLVALQKAANKGEREFLLTELGKVYLRAGFLERAKNVFLEALASGPRNPEALSHLIVIYERLRAFKDAFAALESLGAQGVDVKEWSAYVKALEISSSGESVKEKIAKLSALAEDFAPLSRMGVELAINLGEEGIISNLNLPPLSLCADLLGRSEALAARFDSNLNSDFNLRLLSLARENGLRAKLEFSYICGHCKGSYPLFFYRCPHCARLGGAKIVSNITEEKIEESGTF